MNKMPQFLNGSWKIGQGDINHPYEIQDDVKMTAIPLWSFENLEDAVRVECWLASTREAGNRFLSIVPFDHDNSDWDFDQLEALYEKYNAEYPIS
jgi:hypothetical protein